MEPRRGPWVDHDRARREAAELLGRFAISIDPALPVSQLGVGQKQLVEIVRALSRESRILILDEPTAALDVSVQAVILKLLDDLRREEGLAFLFVSHDLNVVRMMCERTIVLQHGRIVERLKI